MKREFKYIASFFLIIVIINASKPTSSVIYASTSSIFGGIENVVPESLMNSKSQPQRTCEFDSSCNKQGKTASKESLAFFTYYENYPVFCPGSPNYNPNVPVEDCENFSCCDYSGDLAAIGHQPINFIKENNIVAFYDSSDPDGLYWREVYANKTIELSKTYNGRKFIFNATILDNCINADCDDCCIKDSTSTGYLLVMEHYTVMRNFGSVGAVDGLISFRLFN